MRNALAISILVMGASAGAWAAGTPVRAPQSSAESVVTDSYLPPLKPASQRSGVEGLSMPPSNALVTRFSAGWRDRQRRAQRCMQLPKLGPSDFYPLTARQAFAPPPGLWFQPNKPGYHRGFPAYPAVLPDESLDLYLLCLQGVIH